MKAYPKYKDSGIQWVGQVPNHWEVARLKNFTSCNDETLSDSTSVDTIIEYVEIGDVSNTEGIKATTKYHFGDAPSRARRITRKNDIIVSTVRTYLQAITQIKRDDLIVSTGFAVIRPRKGIESGYLAYQMMSQAPIHWIVSNSIGISYPAIAASKVGCVPILLPTPAEQTSIVSFLDSKTSQIDTYIAQKEKQIEALKELKQVEIANAVTHGLNNNTPMKNSGIAWIGDVPQHWDTVRMKYIFKEISEKGHPEEPCLCATQRYGVIPQSMYDNRVVVVSKGFENLKFVRKGNFVISLRSFQGGIEMAHYQGIISAAYTILGLDENILDSEYTRFLFKSHPFIMLLQTCVTGIREGQNINYDILRRKFLPVPPKEEQREIVKYIDVKIKNIDTKISSIQSQISHLKEYKQRLISDVVTGKVDVRNEKI